MPMDGSQCWTIKKYLLCVENSAALCFPVFEPLFSNLHRWCSVNKILVIESQVLKAHIIIVTKQYDHGVSTHKLALLLAFPNDVPTCVMLLCK